MMKGYYGLGLGQNIVALSNTGKVCKWATLYGITGIFMGLQKKYFEMLKKVLCHIPNNSYHLSPDIPDVFSSWL